MDDIEFERERLRERERTLNDVRRKFSNFKEAYQSLRDRGDKGFAMDILQELFKTLDVMK